jgi:4-hydroxy-4-methyl-2-oxoglutarate aldolase
MAHIIKNIERPSRELLDSISKFAPATLHEAQGRSGALHSRIKPIYPGMRAAGPAITVRCHPGDNLMLITAISLARAGDILVVSAGDQPEQGGFGEVLATACLAKGIVGLVTDASVRDGSAIHKRGFNVFSYGLCVKGTVKETLGAINHPIVIGGVMVNPGDFVSADDDGVVVVPRDRIVEVTKSSAEREEKEAQVMAALEQGGDVLELSGMGKVLATKGVTSA